MIHHFIDEEEYIILKMIFYKNRGKGTKLVLDAFGKM